MRDLPPNVYLHSYLKKAGVRFDLNLVDTVVNKGFGLSFYVFLLLLVVLTVCFATGNFSFFPNSLHFYILSVLVIVYLNIYIFRVYKFKHIRRKLRMDSSPIIVEAYAIVLLDISSISSDKTIKPKRSAVLYKESGSLSPRFFTGAIRRGGKQHYYKDQIARVFIDRKNPTLYSVDDDKFYMTAYAKNAVVRPFSIGELATKLNNAVDEKVVK